MSLSHRYWPWIDWIKRPVVILKDFVLDLCKKLMVKEAGFLARVCDAGNPSNYSLTLCCFPIHLKGQVHTHLCSAYRVCFQGGGNSLRPLSKKHQMSVSLSEAFTVTQEGNLDNFLRLVYY